MHFHLELYLAKDVVANVDTTDRKAVEEVVAVYLRQYRENAAGEGGFYDYWSVGGRFTGAHDPQYDPVLDQRNLGPCVHCKGHGICADDANRCRHCYGHGTNVVWPSRYAFFAGDIARVRELKQLRPDFMSAALLVPDHKPLFSFDVASGPFEEDDPATEIWTVENIFCSLDDMHAADDGYLVTIDVHK